jgi:hypothetical protein
MTKNAAKTTLQNKQKKFKNLKTLFETLTLWLLLVFSWAIYNLSYANHQNITIHIFTFSHLPTVCRSQSRSHFCYIYSNPSEKLAEYYTFI